MADIKYYFDEMMSRKAAEQLIAKGYLVIMANDVGMTQKKDEVNLPRFSGGKVKRQGLFKYTELRSRNDDNRSQNIHRRV